MAVRPVLLTVDDDPEVLRAIERDLRRGYGETYRVLRAESAAAAMTLLEQLKLRGDPVALILADQRMPAMTAASTSMPPRACSAITHGRIMTASSPTSRATFTNYPSARARSSCRTACWARS